MKPTQVPPINPKIARTSTVGDNDAARRSLREYCRSYALAMVMIREKQKNKVAPDESEVNSKYK